MKPLCDLCRTHHDKHQAHVFTGPRLVGWVGVEPVANAVANKKRKPGRYKDVEARKKYMRELMKKRRAK